MRQVEPFSTLELPQEHSGLESCAASATSNAGLALAEAMWVLAAVYERDAGQIARAVEMLLNHQQLSLQEPEAVAAALQTFRKRSALGFSDCLLVELARKAGHLPLGTFDRDLSKVDGAAKL